MNNQKPELIVSCSGVLDVHSIFNTIQGEGVFSGRAAVFIRLAGCNLQCPACDTDYTTNRTIMPIEEIVRKVNSFNSKLVVITGGEPFRQDITKLVEILLKTKEVQIETNGTLYLEGFPYKQVTIVCSPKTTKVNKKLECYITAYKYVLSYKDVDKNLMPTKVLGNKSGGYIEKPPEGSLIYVQPCDTGDVEENKLNLDICKKSVMLNDTILCIQTHKIIGVE